MESFNVNTRHAAFGVFGRVSLDAGRPALVAVGGAFPSKTHLHYLAPMFGGGASVLVIFFPGMTYTSWRATDVAGMTQGLDDLIVRLVGDAPTVLFGASTGNLLTLGARSPNIVRRIALEPFFATENLWPFIAKSKERILANPDMPELAAFLWKVFGISPAAVENRDYRYLLEGISGPTDVIAGAAPLLPERPVPEWPSFLEPEYRETLRRNPLVRLHEGPLGSGHGYGTLEGEGLDRVNAVIGAALSEVRDRIGKAS